jgi:hypothetical protein
MGFIVRQWAEPTKFADAIRLDALEQILPHQVVQDAAAAVAAAPTRRRRKLPGDVTLLLCVAMNLVTDCALEVVLDKMVHGLRLFWPDPDIALATKGAICQARYRLGARPVVRVFQQVCRPLATPDTPGAFLFGLRLMAVDGTTEEVPDSPANARAFGRPQSGRGVGAFPQVQGVYLVECGTHAVVDAGFWPCATSERVGGRRVLRTVEPGMLLLWDRGFHSFEMVEDTRARGAQVLGRVPAHVLLAPRYGLPDGSYISVLCPSDPQRRKRGDHLLVRVVVYTLTDPARPGYRETHRLLTTLLDPQAAPAVELICAYHERWEEELTIDELDTHQRLARHPLRSQKPVGVMQELYSLLLAHYAVRALMVQAAGRAGIAPTRLSFVHAVELVCVALDDFQLITPRQHLLLRERLLRAIAACRLPPRAQRTNPRVVKRKMSNFALKRTPPAPASQRLAPFRATIRLLPHGAPSLDTPPCLPAPASADAILA